MSRRSNFYRWQGARPVIAIGDTQVRLPLFYHHNDVFTSVHAASYDAVAAELPSQMIRPARWADDRALVAVTAFRYHAVTWTAGDGSASSLAPYGEISIAAVVTAGPARRVLPLLSGQLRGFVLHLPVTTLEARDGGIAGWGFPKFVADMDFAEDPGFRRVRLSEGGSPILTLTVHPRAGAGRPAAPGRLHGAARRATRDRDTGPRPHAGPVRRRRIAAGRPRGGPAAAPTAALMCAAGGFLLS